MKPNELYCLLNWDEGDRAILHQENLPEVGLWQFDDNSAILDKAEQITIHNHGYIEHDYRRFWQLASVWFMDKPVMIIRTAGREGDDFRDRFITDVPLFWQMVGYLNVLKNTVKDPPPDTVDPEKDIPNLTNFYGDSLRLR